MEGWEGRSEIGGGWRGGGDGGGGRCRRGGKKEERPFGNGASGWLAIGLNKVSDVVTIEVMCIHDGLLDSRRKCAGVWVIGREVCCGECGALRVSVELDAARTNSIGDDVCKMMGLAWMGSHLCLLGDGCGTEFLVWADRRDFCGRLMRRSVEGIVNVCLEGSFGRGGDEGAGSAKFAEGGVEYDVRCLFMYSELGEDVLDGVLILTCTREVPKERLRGSGGQGGERGDMSFKGGEERLESMDEF